MIRRSAGAREQVAASRFDDGNRPMPVKITGWAFLVAATLLILGGAYRVQGNLVSTGLVFLAMGLAFAPGMLRMGWPVRIGLVALVVIGGYYSLVT